MKVPNKIFIPAEIAKMYATNGALYHSVSYVRVDALLDIIGKSGDSLFVELIAGLIDRIK